MILSEESLKDKGIYVSKSRRLRGLLGDHTTSNRETLFILALLILTAIGAFALGRLSVLYEQAPPVILEYPTTPDPSKAHLIVQ